MLQETRGTIVNSSNVKVEISDQPNPGTGIILSPYEKIAFNQLLYAARAPSEYGVAIIGVIEGIGTGTGSTGDPMTADFEYEYIYYSDVVNMFNSKRETHHQYGMIDPGNSAATYIIEETISNEDIDSLFDGVTYHYSSTVDGEQVTDEEIYNLFND